MLAFLPGKPFESEICQIAVQLLGPDLILPDPALPARSTSSGGARACGRRTRGVYNTLPKWEPKPDDFLPGGAHQEGHPFQLGVVAYVAPVVPDGGGFHIVSSNCSRNFYCWCKILDIIISRWVRFITVAQVPSHAVEESA